MATLYRDEAVVLRTHDLGEADRILTILTRHRGLVRAVAKGVRRTASRFGGRLEPFSVVQLQCYEGRSLDTITQAESLALYGAELTSDFEKYRAAWVMAETAERLTDGEPSFQQYDLLVGALRTLARDLAPTELARDGYLLRALALAGWSPELRSCVNCGAAGPHTAIMIGLGGVVCETCRTPGAVRLTGEALELLQALGGADWDTAFAASERARKEAAGFTAAYLQWQLERGLKSLYRSRTHGADRGSVAVTSESASERLADGQSTHAARPR